MRPWLWLYRPQVPTARAQAVQVLHSAAALAATARDVTVFVDPVAPWDPAAVRAFYGLPPVPSLRLRPLPQGRTAASIAFRAGVVAWCVRHPDGIVLARSKRYAARLLALRPRCHLVLEAHEVDSVLAQERGEDPSALHDLEARVLAGARAVVANGKGTLDLLGRTHDLAVPTAVISSGTLVSGPLAPGGEGLAYVGSLHPDKDLPTLVRAAALAGLPLTLIGPGDATVLRTLGGPLLRVESAVPPAAVPATLARFDALAAPVGDSVFGRHLTSPLKLWDARAAGLPTVIADLPAPRAVHPAFLTARPGDVDAWAAVLRHALTAGAVRSARDAARTRTWADRARELVAFVGAAC